MTTLFKLYRHELRFGAWLTVWGGSLLSLCIRMYVGWQFFKAGLTKIKDWNATLALFRDEYTVPLMAPDVAAAAGAGAELLLPALLFAGIGARLSAFGLLGVNVMAVLSYPQLWKFECPAAINDHFYWGALLLVQIAYGPGRVSFDAWFDGRARQRPAD